MLHLLLALTTAPQAGLFKKPPRDPVPFGYKVDLYLCPNNKIRKAGDPDFGTGPIKEPFTRPLGDGGWLQRSETRETCEVDSAVPAVTLYYTRNFRDPSCPYDCAWPLNDAEKTVVRAALKEALDLGSPQERAEKERASCHAKMTYRVKVWACPIGNYVSDPAQCWTPPRSTPAALAAVEVDTRYNILPPGESCVGRADVTHEGGLASVLHKANHEYRGEPKPEGFDVDVKTPVETAGDAWLALEKARKAAMTYDCLAGVCLNTPASSIPDKLVTVSGTKVHRTVEVCSGRVVKINVSAGWVRPEYGGFVDILPGAQHATYSDGTPATDYVYQIRSELVALGWEKIYGETFNDHYESPTKKGERSTGWGRARNGGSWSVYLTTVHPDYNALCTPKRQQGL